MLEETTSNTETIFVYLKDEGTDVWRPTLGRRVGHMVFEVLATPDYDPEDEKWEFVPGTIVECEESILNGARVFVAVRHVAPGQGK
ncbi:MAG: hypothetical protein ACLQPD_14905 [Desulfomonilaceae bacterium]